MSIDYGALVLQAMETLGAGGGSGLVQFFKDGEWTIKLVPMDETGKFFQPYTSMYKGEPQAAVLISCVILTAPEEGIADKARIRYLKVTPPVVRWLIAQMTGEDSWPLLDEKSATVRITRGKRNGKTEYVNSVVRKEFSYAGVEMPEVTLADSAADQEKRELEKAGVIVKDDGEAF